jgi:transcriptional regulatory protein LevR
MELEFKEKIKRGSRGYILMDEESEKAIFSWLNTLSPKEMAVKLADNLNTLNNDESYVMSLRKEDLRSIIQSLVQFISALDSALKQERPESQAVEIMIYCCVILSRMKAIENAE